MIRPTMLNHILTLTLTLSSVFLAAQGTSESLPSFLLKDMKATIETRQKAFENEIMKHPAYGPTLKPEMIWDCISDIKECDQDVRRSVLETCPGVFDFADKDWTMTGACSVGRSAATSPALIARYGDSSAYYESRLDLCEMRRPGCLRAMFDYLKSQEASGDAIPDSVKRARVYIFVDQFPKRHPVSASDKQSPGSDEGPYHTIPGTAHSDSDSDGHGLLGFVLDYCRTDELQCRSALRILLYLCDKKAGCTEELGRIVPSFFAEYGMLSMDDISQIINYMENDITLIAKFVEIFENIQKMSASPASVHDEL